MMICHESEYTVIQMILKCLLLCLYLRKILAENTWKLPDTVIPQHQRIKLFVDLERTEFSGSTEISLKCVEDTFNITLHSRSLIIKAKSVAIKRKRVLNEKVEVAEVILHKEKDFLIINSKKILEKDDEYVLVIDFEGRMSKKPWGFFYGNFTDIQNEEHMFSATYFEPTFARQAFPCFDEPALKSTFEISISRHRSFIALSNMPILKSEPDDENDGWIWDYFDKTPRMSSYLVAFAVLGGYDKVGHESLAIWAPKDAIHLADFALMEVPKYLTFFGKYFGAKYDMPKTDLIALPSYPFWGSAMENWGLLTYRTTMLLHNGSHDLYSVSKIETIAHELAHLWFGNLVTMKCWGQVWLKESFSTFFSYVAMNDVMATGLYELKFAKNHIDIIQYDGNRTLNSECFWDHARARSVFDSTSYIRGGPVLRMTQYFLGFRDLKKTMIYLLSEYKFSNYDSDDLISAFQKSSETTSSLRDISLRDVMSSWLDKPGVPLVEVNRSLNTGTAAFTQESFHENRGRDAQCWWIPITYTSLNKLNNSDLNTKIWMTCPREIVQIEGLDSSEWLLVNVQMSGLYVVKYDEANWNLLSNTMRQKQMFERIPSISRFQLVFDRLILAYYGRVPYESLLETLLYLEHENQYTPWKPVTNFFVKLKHWLDDEPELVGMFVRNLTKPHYSVDSKIINMNSVIEMNFRVLIARTACDFELSECLRDMLEFFELYKNASIEENPIRKEFRSIVYCLVLHRGEESDVEVVMKNFEEIKSRRIYYPDEYHIMKNSMMCMKKKMTRANLFSESSLDNAEVPLLGYNNYKESMFKRIRKKDLHSIAKWLPGFADQLYSAEDLKLFENFVKTNENISSDYQDVIDVSIRKIKKNIHWKELYGEDIKRILRRLLNKPESISQLVAIPTKYSGNTGTIFTYDYLFCLLILLR